jgi:membrane-associated phospholipid phosphatase
MAWPQSLDIALFRFLNQALSNPVFDWLMPVLSGNKFFIPAVILLGFWLLWKGGARGRLFVFFLLLVIAVGDGVICNSLKHGIERLRPFNDITDAVVRIGRGGSGSMPSSHAANWFAATFVAYVFYRRSWRFMLPMAMLVAFSRVYNGVHYPSDVVVGAILGGGYAAGMLWLVDAAWQWVGRRWFPLWWQRLPTLLDPGRQAEAPPGISATPDQHWLRLGYLVILVLLAARWGYLASSTIELSEDEAYQWQWSKHLALAYYSKPPFIAYTQFLGTSIWGDNAFGVRFFAPAIGALLAFLLLQFFAREINARAGFWLVLIVTATPLTAVGATLMTIDPLSVLFWTAAMLSGWRAVQENSTKHWLWTGLWMGCGFLSKATSLFQLACWAVFFWLWPAARSQLRRPGPWLALLVNALCTLPVLIWNRQNGWITVRHLENRAGLDQAWQFRPQFIWDFLAVEAGLLNPVFFVGAIWAAVAFWRRYRDRPLLIYLFSMGAPLFLGYFLYTLRTRVQPNWIAPAILPLFCLMAVYWEARWREGARRVTSWLAGGLALGLFAVVIMHDTNLVGKMGLGVLPSNKDPLVRLRGWREMARLVGEERSKLLAEGRPVFIIGYHYGLTGLISFYLPEAREGVPDHPMVYYLTSDKPENQFYFWPGYTARKGENAVYVQELKGSGAPEAPPARLEKEFASVTELGIREVIYRGRVIHRIRIIVCRDLK